MKRIYQEDGGRLNAGTLLTWGRPKDDADRGEQSRLIFITGLHQIEEVFAHRDARRALGQIVDDAETTLGKIRKALHTLAGRGAHPAKR